MLTDAKYARIKPTPTDFAAPKFPARLVIAYTATAVENMQTHETHAKQTRIYREWKGVEKVLLCHIYTDIEEKYIEHLPDENTSLIKEDIPTVLEYLFAKYGKVPSGKLKKKKPRCWTSRSIPPTP